MFDLIVHADWSVNTPKRWAVVARKESGRWHLSDAEPASFDRADARAKVAAQVTLCKAAFPQLHRTPLYWQATA